MKTEYSYVLLRYVHDVATSESLNVGVVVHAPKAGYLGAQFTSKCKRVKDAFPDLNLQSLKDVLGYLKVGFARKADSLGEFVDYRGKSHGGEIGAIVRSILPEDDSSLQWSDRRGGFVESDGLAGVLEHLYERFIGRHESVTGDHGRQDPEIWKICRPSFDLETVRDKVVKKSFLSEKIDDEIVFEHAWKNGVWNCFEPVSFDLKQADSIRNKAQRLNGKLNDLKGLESDLKVTFLLGEPRDSGLRKELVRAENRLTNTDFKVEVVRERELESWSREMAAKIASAGSV